MRLVLFPKAPGEGALCLQRTLPSACPALSPAGPRREACGLFLQAVPLPRTSVTLSSTRVCLGGISHTFAQAPASPVLLGAALSAAAAASSHLTPGLSLSSARWPPEGLKSNQSFLGPGLAVLVLGLLLGEETRKGEAGGVQLPCSRSAHQNHSLLLLSSCCRAN